MKDREYDRTSYILVVDDDNTLLKFFKIHLNKFFSRVIVVKNAREAIEAIKEKEIDLVITDFNMPRMDGVALLKRVRKHDTAIPVLLISGALLSDHAQDQIDSLADGYLRKPFTVDELHAFISIGMDLRDCMLRLSELLNKKQRRMFRDILYGSIDLAETIKKKAALESIQELVSEAHEILDRVKSVQDGREVDLAAE